MTKLIKIDNLNKKVNPIQKNFSKLLLVEKNKIITFLIETAQEQ